MIKTIKFLVLLLGWIIAGIFVFVDKENSMQWLIIMFILGMVSDLRDIRTKN